MRCYTIVLLVQEICTSMPIAYIKNHIFRLSPIKSSEFQLESTATVFIVKHFDIAVWRRRSGRNAAFKPDQQTK